MLMHAKTKRVLTAVMVACCVAMGASCEGGGNSGGEGPGSPPGATHPVGEGSAFPKAKTINDVGAFVRTAFGQCAHPEEASGTIASVGPVRACDLPHGTITFGLLQDVRALQEQCKRGPTSNIDDDPTPEACTVLVGDRIVLIRAHNADEQAVTASVASYPFMQANCDADFTGMGASVEDGPVPGCRMTDRDAELNFSSGDQAG
ncbi:hypothetical protein [Streptomyces sp. ISL-100]|uniref:hypothetical protein n=1 Tax=Streptomyces sp. ISL-100 TaxID=2819173 RepID=UPI001BEC4910|nr:hypothetical protein [Streptomyces sp. ISL-100]MBT2395410.1 hypothetical protein [Streptomyces sp. ISL-100]